VNNDQLKHIASTLNAIAFAEFAAFGYAGSWQTFMTR
jgi:hypothetical protein